MRLKMILAMFIFAVGVFGGAALKAAAQQEATKPATPTKRTANRSFMSGGYAYKFTEQDFVGVPVWNQADEEPPISVSRALKTARESLPRFVKNVEFWKLGMVSLESMGDEFWYYRIHFFCANVVCRDLETRSFYSIIKMDGNIIEPKKVTIEK